MRHDFLRKGVPSISIIDVNSTSFSPESSASGHLGWSRIARTGGVGHHPCKVIGQFQANQSDIGSRLEPGPLCQSVKRASESAVENCRVGRNSEA